MLTRKPALQTALVSCLLLAVATSAFAQSETYNQDGLNNSTLATSYVSYTDATGASLKASHVLTVFTPIWVWQYFAV